MGEEKKKKQPEGEQEKKTEEKQTEEGEKKAEKDDKPKPDEKESKDDAPPPPPPEIVMRVYMHCEGCARKVRRCLKGFHGVEEVLTDCKSQKVVVKGEKADPLKVLDRVQKKTHRQVELLSPLPKPPVEGEEQKKVEEKKEDPKPEEKKEEPKVITVVIKVHMHCEACSLEIKRRIEKMKEVEEAIPDLKSSTVSVKGTFDPPKLVQYVHKRTGKHATIVKIDPPPPEKKEEGDKGKDGKEETKGDDDGNKGAGGGGGGGDDGNKGEKKEEGGEEAKAAESSEGGAAPPPEEAAEKVVELKRNEYYHYPPRYGMEMYAYPPQIFSDENPNACSIM